MTGMRHLTLLLLLAAAAVAACSDGRGNSLSTGVGGTMRSEYGRTTQR